MTGEGARGRVGGGPGRAGALARQSRAARVFAIRQRPSVSAPRFNLSRFGVNVILLTDPHAKRLSAPFTLTQWWRGRFRASGLPSPRVDSFAMFAHLAAAGSGIFVGLWLRDSHPRR